MQIKVVRMKIPVNSDEGVAQIPAGVLLRCATQCTRQRLGALNPPLFGVQRGSREANVARKE